MRSDFVEECRREWRRLRVPAVSAEEMADDLDADLREAEADGAFPEEVLGDGAADPRAFAAAWATERGLVRPRRFAWLSGRRAVLVGVGLVGLLIAGAVLGAVIDSSHARAVPHSTTQYVSPRVFARQAVGTEVYSAVVMPGHVQIAQSARTAIVLARRPTELVATIKNSGETTVRKVAVVVTVAGHTYTRATGSLRRGGTRHLTFTLPVILPSQFILSVRTEPIPGEVNLANNQVTRHIHVRR